jgi:hypothetical protein
MSEQQRRIQGRIALGAHRIGNILKKHGIATMRMLEQKISDAGPNPQRVDPHILTKSRILLVEKDVIGTRMRGSTPWYFLKSADPTTVDGRFAELSAIQSETEQRAFTDRMGDTAEIAVMKAMQQSKLQFVGHFADLDQHGDDQRYLKHDPDFFSGVPILGGKLDYILFNSKAAAWELRSRTRANGFIPIRISLRNF